jgi:Xaa-Pro aminopeptidase
MNIQKRINALRSAMIQKGIDIYIIPTADFHHSEYVGDYFKFREYMTGFTGSAGTAVFTSKRLDFGQTDVILSRQSSS